MKTAPAGPWVARTVAVAASLWIVGCQAPPTIQDDLEAARAAYERGRNDPVVVRNASPELENARRALAEADQAWAERADADETRHLSALAARKAELALATGQQGAAEERRQQLEAERRTGRAAPPQALRDQMALQQALQPLQSRAGERGLIVTVNDVLFGPGQTVLQPATWRTVERVVQALEQFPAQRVVINGHADNTGSAAHNLALSWRRAEALKAALVSRGVAPQRVLMQAYGERLPVADNARPEGRALNRRAEVVFPQAREPQPASRVGVR